MGTSDLFKAKYRDILCVCVTTFYTLVCQKWQCGIYWPLHELVDYSEVENLLDFFSVISYILSI